MDSLYSLRIVLTIANCFIMIMYVTPETDTHVDKSKRVMMFAKFCFACTIAAEYVALSLKELCVIRISDIKLRVHSFKNY